MKKRGVRSSIRGPSRPSTVGPSKIVYAKHCIISIVLGLIMLLPKTYVDYTANTPDVFEYSLLVTFITIAAFVFIAMGVAGFMSILIYGRDLTRSTSSQTEIDMIRIRNAVESDRTDNILKRK